MRGYTVCPGFIDPHTIKDLSDPQKKSQFELLKQGVTTVIAGNDGGGPIKVDDYFKKWSRQGIRMNAALLRHGTIRKAVIRMEKRETKQRGTF